VRDRASGFSLLEVLVALALTGLILLTMGTLMERQIKGEAYLEQKVAAAQLAFNLMEQFRLDGAPSEPALKEGNDEMGGWKFPWRRKVSRIGPDKAYRVEIAIGPTENALFLEKWTWASH